MAIYIMTPWNLLEQNLISWS